MEASDTETDLRHAVTHQPLAQWFSLDSGDLVGGVVPGQGDRQVDASQKVIYSI